MRVVYLLTWLRHHWPAPRPIRRWHVCEQQIEYVAHATDGVAGVDAVHIETGRSVSLRGTEAYPMASAFKLPVAVQILSLVDEGKLTLDKMVLSRAARSSPGQRQVDRSVLHPGVSLSIAESAGTGARDQRQYCSRYSAA